MALFKELDSGKGYPMTYHRILPESITADGATLASYVSKDIRDANEKAYVATEYIKCNLSKEDFVNGTVFSTLYSKITESRMEKRFLKYETTTDENGDKKTEVIFEDVESNKYIGALTI